MAKYIERPSGTVGHYADTSQYPIWCDHPEDWEGLDCQLVDQQVTRGMIERSKGVDNTYSQSSETLEPTEPRRRRKKNNVVLKGDDTTVAKGTTYE